MPAAYPIDRRRGGRDIRPGDSGRGSRVWCGLLEGAPVDPETLHDDEIETLTGGEAEADPDAADPDADGADADADGADADSDGADADSDGADA